MHLSDFNYNLPERLIAYYPPENRTDSRLMVLRQGEIAHQQFPDILSYLDAGDLLVLNDTRVMPARLLGQRATGGKVEVLIERVLDSHEVVALVRSSKSPKPGDHLILEGCLKFEMVARQEAMFRLRCLHDEPVVDLLETHGHIPLPPYIDRDVEAADKQRYQTVFAKHNGSAAAPTAGLHFDEALLEKIAAKGVQIGFVTLHVGSGTFQPVRVDKIEEHQIHAEYIDVSAALCDKINATKAAGKRVIAVGTTSVRSLESAAQQGKIEPFSGDTNIYIYPGYEFKCIDGMVTNFHLPESTLLMLVCAFGGYEAVMQAYHTAIEQHYRFYSYGDAMLLMR